MLIGQRDLGEPYCSAEDNSTGTFATTRAVGSTDVSLETFRLEAHEMPTNQFGYFLASQTQDDVLFPGGSAGRLCLGGNIGRFVNQVQNTGAAGQFGIWVDLSAIPVNPAAAVQPGDTWNWQAWFRDGMTSNFSLPISVTFD